MTDTPKSERNDEQPPSTKKPFQWENATKTRMGGGLQIIGAGPPKKLQRLQFKPGATAKQIAEALRAHEKARHERPEVQ